MKITNTEELIKHFGKPPTDKEQEELINKILEPKQLGVIKVEPNNEENSVTISINPTNKGIL